MRGGERLVNECSWLSGICFGLHHSTEQSETLRYRCPSSVMVNNRFRSADYLPCQLPLGGSRGVLTLYIFHSTNRSVALACGRILSAPTVGLRKPTSARHRTGRALGTNALVQISQHHQKGGSGVYRYRPEVAIVDSAYRAGLLMRSRV